MISRVPLQLQQFSDCVKSAMTLYSTILKISMIPQSVWIFTMPMLKNFFLITNINLQAAICDP